MGFTYMIQLEHISKFISKNEKKLNKVVRLEDSKKWVTMIRGCKKREQKINLRFLEEWALYRTI